MIHRLCIHLLLYGGGGGEPDREVSFACRGKIVYTSRVVRVILAQGPC